MVEEGQPIQRRLPACERCRSRKTKCDSELPSCANCVKAGVPCMNKDRVLGRAVTRSYVCSLEDRIRAFGENGEPDLETFEPPNKRPRLSEERSPPKNPVNTTPPEIVNGDRPESTRSASSSDEDNGDEIGSPRTSRAMEALLVSTLSSGGPATHVSDDLSVELNQYPGSNGLRGEREQFIQNENIAIAKLGRDFLGRARRTRSTNIAAYDFKLLARLAKRYFTWMGSAHPILHECVLHLQLEKCRMRPNEATAQDNFQVNMVIAISLASISRPHLSTSEIGRYAHDFWKLASKSLGQMLSGRGIQKLQNILLLLQYTLLVPKSGNLWQLSGTAMRFATELGLYAEPSPSQEFDPLALDLRRRVFWTCYCIDRILSTVMGRPTSIPDSWITAKIPALVEDRLITVKGISHGPICQLKVAQVQQIRICRLQSEIHKRLYAPVMDESILEENTTAWMWHMYDQLRLWRDSFTYATPLITKEWTELQFHIAVVLLFRPSPNRPNPSDEALHVAFHSAGEAMKLVKTMHRDLSAVFSWLTVQNLFMCGLTFINSLKEFADKHTPHQLCISFVEIFLQIQACTAMLETLSALEAGSNERIRNVFEMASSNVLHNLASSSPRMQQSGHYSKEGCIWAQIAKSDHLMIQRPIAVEGTSIAIKLYSSILDRTNDQNWSTSLDHVTNEHFSNHDIDAAPVRSLLPLDDSLYSVAVGTGAIPAQSAPNGNPHAQSMLPSRESSLPPSSQSATFSPPVSLSFNDPDMNGLAAISKVAAEAEPLKNANDLPDWSEADLGAELERWFLYPFPEISPPVSVMMNDQGGS